MQNGPREKKFVAIELRQNVIEFLGVSSFDESFTCVVVVVYMFRGVWKPEIRTSEYFKGQAAVIERLYDSTVIKASIIS